MFYVQKPGSNCSLSGILKHKSYLLQILGNNFLFDNNLKEYNRIPIAPELRKQTTRSCRIWRTLTAVVGGIKVCVLLKERLGQQMSLPPRNRHTKLLCGSLGNSRLTYCLSLQCQQEGKQSIMSVWRICVCYIDFFSIPFFISHWDFVVLYAYPLSYFMTVRH